MKDEPRIYERNGLKFEIRPARPDEIEIEDGICPGCCGLLVKARACVFCPNCGFRECSG